MHCMQTLTVLGLAGLGLLQVGCASGVSHALHSPENRASCRNTRTWLGVAKVFAGSGALTAGVAGGITAADPTEDTAKKAGVTTAISAGVAGVALLAHQVLEGTYQDDMCSYELNPATQHLTPAMPTPGVPPAIPNPP